MPYLFTAKLMVITEIRMCAEVFKENDTLSKDTKVNEILQEII